MSTANSSASSLRMFVFPVYVSLGPSLGAVELHVYEKLIGLDIVPCCALLHSSLIRPLRGLHDA